MPKPSQLTTLDELLTKAEDYASCSMRNCGRVPPTLMALGRDGLICFVPESMGDERAKDNFALTSRLICVAHRASAAVMILEAWMAVAAANGSLDLTVPPSEAANRREVVMLNGESHFGGRQKFLPIIRTDAGGFFGFGEFDGPPVTSLRGRFTQFIPPKTPTREMEEYAHRVLTAMGVAAGALLRDPFAN